ncbi:MAG: hypothetical protein QM800_09485 [Paludibacter sp.]
MLKYGLHNAKIDKLTRSAFMVNLFLITGASAPTPDLLFVLPQKVSKKVKTSPASLEKLAFSWLKPSKLAPSSLKQDSFKRHLHWFFGSSDEVTRWKAECNLIAYIFLLIISMKYTRVELVSRYKLR